MAVTEQERQKIIHETLEKVFDKLAKKKKINFTEEEARKIKEELKKARKMVSLAWLGGHRWLLTCCHPVFYTLR